MSEEELLKKIREIIKSETHPIHGEIAKLTSETRGFRSDLYMSQRELKQVGLEVARIGLVLDEFKDWVVEQLGQIHLKLDTLLLDIHNIQQDIVAFKDGMQLFKAQHQREHDEIRKQVGLPALEPQ